MGLRPRTGDQRCPGCSAAGVFTREAEGSSRAGGLGRGWVISVVRAVPRPGSTRSVWSAAPSVLFCGRGQHARCGRPLLLSSSAAGINTLGVVGRSFCPVPRPGSTRSVWSAAPSVLFRGQGQHARCGRPLLLSCSAAGINTLGVVGRSFCPVPRPGSTRSVWSAAPSDPFRGRDLTGRSAFSLILNSGETPASNKAGDFNDFVRRGGRLSPIFNLEKAPASNKTGDFNDFVRRSVRLSPISNSEMAPVSKKQAFSEIFLDGRGNTTSCISSEGARVLTQAPRPTFTQETSRHLPREQADIYSGTQAGIYLGPKANYLLAFQAKTWYHTQESIFKAIRRGWQD